MDYVTLRQELLNGMRLSHPILATANVAHILQTCWLAEPDARPSFSRIMESLYEDVKFPKKLLNHCEGSCQVSNDVISMQTQHKARQKCSPMYKVEGSSIDEGSDITAYPKSSESIIYDKRSSTDTYDGVTKHLLPSQTPSQIPKDSTLSTTSTNQRYLSSTTSIYLCQDDDHGQEMIELALIDDDVFD